MRNAGERGGKLLEVRLENGANDFKNERAIAMQSELRRTALSAVTTEAYEIAICFLRKIAMFLRSDIAIRSVFG